MNFFGECGSGPEVALFDKDDRCTKHDNETTECHRDSAGQGAAGINALVLSVHRVSPCAPQLNSRAFGGGPARFPGSLRSCPFT